MKTELFQTSVIILAFMLVGFLFWKLVYWVKHKDESKKNEKNLEDLKKNAWLEVKKGRGYGRNKFFLVTLKQNKKVRSRISALEFDAYLNLGIEPKGHAAIKHANSIKTVQIG